MTDRTFPEGVPDIARVAAALADPSRAAMCTALMDGRAWTVGELGTWAGLARSTATEHVNLLVDRGLVEDVRQGRHRYIRLAGDRVAAVIEALGAVAADPVRIPRTLRAVSATDRLRQGRTCYSHLAGRLGVELAGRFLANGWLSDSWELTDTGRNQLSRWGIPEAVTVQRCMDSTERRFHIAGELGRALCTAAFDNGWVERVGETRAVRLTAAGWETLAAP